MPRIPPSLLRLAITGLAAVFAGNQAGASGEFKATMLLLDAAVVGKQVVAVGERGTILRSPDAGGTWRQVPSPTLAALTGVAFAADGKTGWAVGHDALILRTTDGGTTWTKVFQGPNLETPFLDVGAVDDTRVIAVGSYGLYAESNDAGLTWLPRMITSDELHLNRISRGPTGTLYIAGERGTLLRSPDRGNTWESIPSPYEGSFYGILPLNESTLIAYGLRGHLYRSVDNGGHWTAISTGHPSLIATGVRMKNGLLVLAGQSRGFFLSRDHGVSFSHWAEAPVSSAVAELVELPDGRLLAVGEIGLSFLTAP